MRRLALGKSSFDVGHRELSKPGERQGARTDRERQCRTSRRPVWRTCVMTIRKREGNRPDRRLADEDFLTTEQREALCGRLTYVGSANHKLRPGDYGFRPSHNPRPSKSLCDGQRTVLLAEAAELMRRGIMLGMVSR